MLSLSRAKQDNYCSSDKMQLLIQNTILYISRTLQRNGRNIKLDNHNANLQCKLICTIVTGVALFLVREAQSLTKILTPNADCLSVSVYNDMRCRIHIEV